MMLYFKSNIVCIHVYLRRVIFFLAFVPWSISRVLLPIVDQWNSVGPLGGMYIVSPTYIQLHVHHFAK